MTQHELVEVRCAGCSYDVSRVSPSGVCPECGWAMRETLDGFRRSLRVGLSRMRVRLPALAWIHLGLAILQSLLVLLMVSEFLIDRMIGSGMAIARAYTIIELALMCIIVIATLMWWGYVLASSSRIACMPWRGIEPFRRRLKIAAIVVPGVLALANVVIVSLPRPWSELYPAVIAIISILALWWLFRTLVSFLGALASEPSVGVAIPALHWRNHLLALVGIIVLAVGAIVPLTTEPSVPSGDPFGSSTGANAASGSISVAAREVPSSWWTLLLLTANQAVTILFLHALWRACRNIAAKIPVTTELFEDERA